MNQLIGVNFFKHFKLKHMNFFLNFCMEEIKMSKLFVSLHNTITTCKRP